MELAIERAACSRAIDLRLPHARMQRVEHRRDARLCDHGHRQDRREHGRRLVGRRLDQLDLGRRRDDRAREMLGDIVNLEVAALGLDDKSPGVRIDSEIDHVVRQLDRAELATGAQLDAPQRTRRHLHDRMTAPRRHVRHRRRHRAALCDLSARQRTELQLTTAALRDREHERLAVLHDRAAEDRSAWRDGRRRAGWERQPRAAHRDVAATGERNRELVAELDADQRAEIIDQAGLAVDRARRTTRCWLEVRRHDERQRGRFADHPAAEVVACEVLVAGRDPHLVSADRGDTRGLGDPDDRATDHVDDRDRLGLDYEQMAPTAIEPELTPRQRPRDGRCNHTRTAWCRPSVVTD